MKPSEAGSNWAGTYAYRAARLHRPETVEQLQELVARAPRVRVLGSRHSFSDIADSAELVALDGLPPGVTVDHAAGTVSLGAAVRYGELAETLHAEGVALHNLASLPHISVAGAVATATHGSGDRSGNLATAVAALELVTSDGELVTAARGDADFDGLVVGLGALGAVTRVTLDVEPDYEIAQRVYEGLTWDALFEHFDEITACGDSVSVFTRWDDAAGAVWVKSRAAPDFDELLGAVAATGERHPIPGLDPVHCTRQQGVPGRWSDRLPHFQMGFTPSAGEEIQSEYLVPRAHAAGRHRSRARARRRDPSRAPGQRDPHDRRRRAVAEPAVRSGHGRHPLHVEARARAGRPADRGAGGRAGGVRAAAALGQAVPRRRRDGRRPLRAPTGLRAARRAPRSPRRLPQRLARAPRPRLVAAH